MRLLFVGNSLTFFHDLPGTIQRLAAAGGMGGAAVESVVRGGITFVGHLRSGKAAEAIGRGGADWVVLQEQSTRPFEGPALFHHGAAALHKEVQAASGGTLLYLTWAKRGRGGDQASLDAAYAGAAARLGARVVPVGP